VIGDNDAIEMANSSASPLDLGVANNRSSSSVAGSYNGSNGQNNGANYASPLPAGHQQDLNYLYQQIQELSEVLKSNRQRTAELARIAQEAEVCFKRYSCNAAH
jgi:hypothetical protein